MAKAAARQCCFEYEVEAICAGSSGIWSGAQSVRADVGSGPPKCNTVVLQALTTKKKENPALFVFYNIAACMDGDRCHRRWMASRLLRAEV